MKAVFKNAWPYQKDKMNLPVANVDDAAQFYVKHFRFAELSRETTPVKKVLLQRDDVTIGLAENGGDPTQDGCFFEVEDVANAYNELKANGVDKISPEIGKHVDGGIEWKTFFVIAPDGLCYCIGERAK